jgi:UPF0716 protein FxsA
MFFLILLIFILFPVAEVIVIAKVASRIGIWDTLFLMVFSGAFGAYLANLQGRTALLKIQQALAEGRAPTAEMLDSFLVFLGGILFIVPGFLSDILGFFLIFPVTRWLFRWWVLGAIKSNFRSRAERKPGPGTGGQAPGRRDHGDVQDAEIVEEK